METRWIQDFVMLAEVKNFTRAAELRNVSQAAFSRRIQALEQWVGAALVDRSAFPMRVTAAGERFLPEAMALLNHIDYMRTEVGCGASGNVGDGRWPAAKCLQWPAGWSQRPLSLR